MKKDSAFTAVKNLRNVLFCQFAFTVKKNLITLDAHNLTGILVHEVLYPTLQHTGSQLLAKMRLQAFCRNLYFLCKVKYFQYVTVILKADSTQQGCYWQLLLTVNVSVHHILDVSCELYPTTLERNNTGRVQLSTIAMDAAAEKYTRRTVQLANDNTLGTIDNKGTVVCHVWNGTKEDILNNCIEILMIGIGTVKLQLCLQGDTVSQATLKALFYRISWWIDIIVQELKNKVIASIRYGEVLAEDLVQTIVLTEFRWSIQLEEVPERLQLHIKEIRISIWSLDGCEIYSVVNNVRHLFGRF